MVSPRFSFAQAALLVDWTHRFTQERLPDPAKKALLLLARRLRGQRVSLRAIQTKLAEKGETVSHVAIDRATKGVANVP